ncbi:MAG: 50S ribosomal protein L10 [Pyrinomonadaceae bacterium]|nr:50S ribosomal protein L10 [Acidobacteriota bacterium]MBP7376780.1 50S ribosomal protein L10 [Pyrinomonadaceae bacterium]
MKNRETKARDLAALTESLSTSKSAMVVSFTKLTVTKDQEFRAQLREAGAKYQVVKNTLARIAVKGTQFEDTTESLKGVTAIAWTDGDPVVLSKAISKFMKDNADIYTFKSGVVDGKLVDLAQLTTIANLPSKEELISKLMWVLNSGAQRLVTVINAVPRDLAVVIKQIGEAKPAEAATVAAAPAAEAPAAAEAAPVAEIAVAEDAPAVEAAPEESPEAVSEPDAGDSVAEVEADAAPAVETAVETVEEEVLEEPTEAEAEEKAE